MTLEVFDMEQGSYEWFEARCGVVTASCFKDVLTKGRGDAPSKTRRTYMLKVASERVRNLPAEVFSNEHMERGNLYEDDVVALYEERTGNQVEKIGFIKDGNIGTSADGLVGDEGIIEIKTRLGHLQAELLLDGDIPKEHVAQIQGNLLVSGRQWVDFVSYCPGMPLFIERMGRDEEYLENLQKELGTFEQEIEQATNAIMAMF